MGNLDGFDADLAGDWSGSCSFRLMPDDELAPGDSTASFTGGVLDYSWTHPSDGLQRGRLVRTADGATWTDTWHQPDEASLTGDEVDGELRLTMTYLQEWGWTIALSRHDDEAIMLMHNVIPDSYATEGKPAGPYLVMEARWRRN